MDSRSRTRREIQVFEDAERPPKRPLPTPPAGINMNKHESHCSVCQHPQREVIEEEFIHWFSPRATARDHGIDVRAIYRHAHAFNLFAVRNRKIRFVLSHALERAEHAETPTADALNRMVRTFTRVNDDGQWFEPPAHVIVSSGSPAAAPRFPREMQEEAIDISPSGASSSAHRNRAKKRRRFSTRRAEKNTTQVVENTRRRPSFLDTQKQGRNRRPKRGNRR